MHICMKIKQELYYLTFPATNLLRPQSITPHPHSASIHFFLGLFAIIIFIYYYLHFAHLHFFFKSLFVLIFFKYC